MAITLTQIETNYYVDTIGTNVSFVLNTAVSYLQCTENCAPKTLNWIQYNSLTPELISINEVMPQGDFQKEAPSDWLGLGAECDFILRVRSI